MVADPAEQPFQDSFVLLDDEKPRTLFGRDPQFLSNASAEIAVVSAIGCVVGPNRGVTMGLSGISCAGGAVEHV
jgi:hypothetical protein